MNEVFTPRRRAVGVAVMVAIALLQLATEYLAFGDHQRLLAKAVALAAGLPVVIAGGFALFRWAIEASFGRALTRVHRNWLVNLASVKEMERDGAR